MDIVYALGPSDLHHALCNNKGKTFTLSQIQKGCVFALFSLPPPFSHSTHKNGVLYIKK